MFGFFGKKHEQINTSEIIDKIEDRVYAEMKPLGFRKYGRTLHRFVGGDNEHVGDISQVINFQCGQAYRNETYLMWVNVGIRVPECMCREFHPAEQQKKYYHEYECSIRSVLGTVKKAKESCYDLRKDSDRISEDILHQLNHYVLPVFDVLNSREMILKERRNYPHFDVTHGHLILLEEAMIYGHMGDLEKAAACFNQHYKRCSAEKEPAISHVRYLKELADKLGIPLEN